MRALAKFFASQQYVMEMVKPARPPVQKIEEIHQMNPNKEYEFLAINTIEYLHNILLISVELMT